MEKQGILIDYHYCTGCHSCEVACQQEHGFPAGTFGIVVTEHILNNRDGLSIDYVPFKTDLCTLCGHLTARGEEPSCVKHCQSKCMYFGPLDELLEEMKKRPKMLLYSHQ
jgi:Fe-S-cluster-containing dehydrogenase component